ncbi:MAG: caspase family protein [Nitrospira sp.]|nr:caspase family protein [Nitrospira sp.]
MVSSNTIGAFTQWTRDLAIVLGLLFLIGCVSADVRKFQEGQSLAHNGKPQEAIQAYRDALEENPRLVEASLNIGVLFYQQGRVAQAAREFKLVLEQDPEYARARENLAITLEAKGDTNDEAKIEAYAEAHKHWQVAMANEYRAEWKAYGKQSIERLKEKLRMAGEPDVDIPPSDVDTTVPTFAVAPRPHDIALVIGIETYESQSLTASPFARADAERVAKYLSALGYDSRNVEVLINERAMLATIRSRIEHWVSKRAKTDSRVLIYYSGHGSMNPATGDTYLVPYDGNPSDLLNTAYSTKRLYIDLSDLNVNQVVVMLDSCFSGKGSRSVLMEGARPVHDKTANPVVLTSRRLAVLTASSGNQVNIVSQPKQHGLFTYYWLKALLDGQQDLAAIYDYVSPKVQKEANLQDIQQAPSLWPGAEQIRGEFTLWDKP